MAFISSKPLFQRAYKEGYAVGAFNINDMEILQGITEAIAEEKAPVILQVSAGARKYARHQYLIHLVQAAMECTGIDCVLHLDHGEDFEVCKACVDGGFTSVMIDGSKHPFEENIALTKQVVDYAHAKGVPVEAELGKLAGVEDNISVTDKDAIYTDPNQAVEFVKSTGCDSLAVAIGTSHGAYKFKGEPKLDFERLEKIKNLLPGFPLVLHGASSAPADLVKVCNDYGGQIPGARGVPEEMIARATKMGVCKVNIDTDLRLAMTGAIRKVFAENPGEFDPRKYLGPARDAIKLVVKRKIKFLGCGGKA
ncbi:MAG: fructose-1,6-bisphosphate aldolase, class II [Omnitrophica WOR_2 bacterium RIFCSPHIGHO2_01_FULL_49_10]|nr:MAG: fructose-1,6-bisphosphate aldolase, class II [Omnitrophica WOR_2 bacterium RIFCSPHIGHO2_01_FULL_49_10]OGX32945.1 MAG: fructose-1,6-bisphosphate aldolase, class II [Omnitrophica WOR_2 bacterium RIFCSPLOWO2_02_FULL_50_19]